MSSSGWWDVFKVIQGTDRIIGTIVDAVFASSTKEALQRASERNGLKPWEEFGVRRAVGGIGRNQSIARHARRTNQIEDLIELIEDHV